MCVCGKKVLAIKKTKHLVNMDHPTDNWLLFVTAQGITWTRDGTSEPDAPSAVGDVSSGSSQGFQVEAFGGHWTVGRGSFVPSGPCRDKFVRFCFELGQAPTTY